MGSESVLRTSEGLQSLATSPACSLGHVREGSSSTMWAPSSSWTLRLRPAYSSTSDYLGSLPASFYLSGAWPAAPSQLPYFRR